MIEPSVLQIVWGQGDPLSPTYDKALRGTPYEEPLWGLLRDRPDAPAPRIGQVRGSLGPVTETERIHPVLGFAFPDAPAGSSPIIPKRSGQPFKLTPNDMGNGYRLDVEATRTFAITFGGKSHIVTLDMRAGGIVDSWAYDDGGGAVELINRGGSQTRGIQAGLHYSDAGAGEFWKFDPVQGGDRFSRLGDPRLRFGGRVISAVEKEEAQGGVSFTVVTIPVDLDPDGFYAVPALEGGHGGGVGQPVLWLPLRLTQKLWLNWQGNENLHRIESAWHFPNQVDSAFFDMDLYNVFFLDADTFSTVRAYDAGTDTATTISNGVVGNPNYQAESRVYSMNRSIIRGDDETPGASQIPSGRGGIAAGGATDGDLAVMIITDCSQDSLGATQRVLNDSPPTGWKWAQRRDVSSGHDGAGLVMLSTGQFLTGHFHPPLSTKSIEQGTLLSAAWIATDTWTNCKTLAKLVV